MEETLIDGFEGRRSNKYSEGDASLQNITKLKSENQQNEFQHHLENLNRSLVFLDE